MAAISLYLFNPDHDLALASGETNYMSPASARQMAADLAILPAWYAENDSAVLASSAYHAAFLKTMEETFGGSVRLITPPELASMSDFEVIPWGWNPALRRHLLSLGVREVQLPSFSYMEQLRQCSHRLQAVELLSRFCGNDYFCGESYYLTTPDTWRVFVEKQVACLLKAPLSGSGKGLNWCKGKFTSSISGWCARIASSQGGIIGEPVYDKVQDFAMEFYSDGVGKVTFVGYSVFQTGASGMYDGNLLLSDERILNLLSEYVPLDCLEEVRVRLVKELSALIGSFYKGYLGVDMMICRFHEEKTVFRIHPCVEMNLRMNMGVVAHCLTKRFLTPATKGEFRIAYYPSDGLALHEHQQMASAFPLKVKNGRIISGYQSLAPVVARSRYRAWIHCEADSM